MDAAGCRLLTLCDGWQAEYPLPYWPGVILFHSIYAMFEVKRFENFQKYGEVRSGLISCHPQRVTRVHNGHAAASCSASCCTAVYAMLAIIARCLAGHPCMHCCLALAMSAPDARQRPGCQADVRCTKMVRCRAACSASCRSTRSICATTTSARAR